ncbi:MAG: hypothetical protein ACRDZR_17065 [Acidimicrobiales bacterium]
MNAHVPEDQLVSAVEMLCFVADLCASQQETLNVALCRFTHSYYPAKDLRAEAKELADDLARALGFADSSLEPKR